MPIMRRDQARVAAVTTGLTLAGASFGATAGVLVLALRAVPGHWPVLFDPWLYAWGAIIGAPLGAFCAPVAGWLLLREVPLGRAFVWSTAGTVVGGAIGWLTGDGFPPGPIVGGAVGCLVAALLLRLLSKRRLTGAWSRRGERIRE